MPLAGARARTPTISPALSGVRLGRQQAVEQVAHLAGKDKIPVAEQLLGARLVQVGEEDLSLADGQRILGVPKSGSPEVASPVGLRDFGLSLACPGYSG